jgi:hypothetical protein
MKNSPNILAITAIVISLGAIGVVTASQFNNDKASNLSNSSNSTPDQTNPNPQTLTPSEISNPKPDQIDPNPQPPATSDSSNTTTNQPDPKPQTLLRSGSSNTITNQPDPKPQTPTRKEKYLCTCGGIDIGPSTNNLDGKNGTDLGYAGCTATCLPESKALFFCEAQEGRFGAKTYSNLNLTGTITESRGAKAVWQCATRSFY